MYKQLNDKSNKAVFTRDMKMYKEVQILPPASNMVNMTQESELRLPFVFKT